jgi:tetratricopeptide (TPR) repeat protein
MEPEADGASTKALFISRAGVDADFASIIGTILETSGYAVTLQQWDFKNHSFMERMHAALAGGARVVALLSPEYLRSAHCQAEWQNAIADDPLNTKGRLTLLRVAECEPIGLLSSLAYWDLVPVRDNRALLEEIVRNAVREGRHSVAPSGPHWRAPRTVADGDAIRPVSSFSGRDADLAAIAVGLSSDGHVVAITGLGGAGKSSVAREYAWQNRDSYAVVWWLRAQTEDGIIDDLLRLGALLTRGLDQVADRRAAAQQVTHTMLSGFSKPVLLIFDNLEDERLLRTWQPRAGSEALVTSRNAVWGAGVTAIPLGAWPPSTATDYLRRESGRADLTEDDARAIVEALGALPLALSHAAASLRQMRMVTPQRYLQRIGEYLGKAPRDAEYPSSVFATFNSTIAQAEQQAPGAASLLCFAALFAPEAIPEELFTQAIELYAEGLAPVLREGKAVDLGSTVADEMRLYAALGALDGLSLVSFSEGSRTYSLHRLVRLAARDAVVETASEWLACAVAVAGAAFPEVAFAAWPQCERLLPHALAVLEGEPSDSDSVAAATLAVRCGEYLCERGSYPTAEPLFARALAIFETALGPDHPEIANVLDDLAFVYRKQRRYAEGEGLQRRALAIWEKALGPDHPDFANSLNGLAAVYRNQGRYAEAESLHARALAIFEKALGPDHPDVATALNNLAASYRDQGRYAETEELHARALAIWEKTLGPDHPDVAYSLNGLAVVYRNQGRYADAESLHARALAISEKALGPDHPDVAISLHDLAVVYRNQGRYAEAESLHVRALAIREKTLGPDHPEVATILNGLAVVYRDQGRNAEAEAVLTRTLAILERAFGTEDPRTRAAATLRAATQ